MANHTERETPLAYAIVARDKDFPADPPRVLIRGDKVYCDKYLEDARANGGWLDNYLSQPNRWTVAVEYGHYSVVS